jgi:UDP-N-acetylglucosamine acyltransferase
MSKIHPTAIIDPKAELADDVIVGPYVVIEGKVIVGAGSTISAHSILHGHTIVGEKCRIGPAAYVGFDPQHLSYDGSETSLMIGDETIIRETAIMHRSLKPGLENATRIGKRCFLMGASHVGHDCRVGDDVILAQGAYLGGHVEVGDRAFLGGGCVIHQFCRIGRLTIIRGNEAISKDVPPFGATQHWGLQGYNLVGCRRAGLSREAIHGIRRAYQCIHQNRTVPNAAKAIRAIMPQVPELKELLDFIAGSKRGILPSIRAATIPTDVDSKLDAVE